MIGEREVWKMVIYSVYWLKEEVARNYFHKSELLFRFFKEYENNQHRSYLKKQYHYITSEFPKEKIHFYVRKQFGMKSNLTKEREDSRIDIFANNKFISLHIGEKRLKFHSESLQDAEEILFPLLRQMHPYLFVVGNTYENYGWISPMKNISYPSKSKEVLYSCD